MKTKFVIVRDDFIVLGKKFNTESEAKKWGKWNYKGDENFKVITTEEVKLLKLKKLADKNFLKTPPDTLVINGHVYKRV